MASDDSLIKYISDYLPLSMPKEDAPCQGGDDVVVIGNLLGQKGLFQIPILYLLKKIGMLLEVHGGLVLQDDNANFLARAEFL
ncbi:MAG: hypothetical protein LBU37_13075 [Tannerellaceae bacterium]|nr:hypothetical protein [Tannerellaceae bacterium]